MVSLFGIKYTSFAMSSSSVIITGWYLCGDICFVVSCVLGVGVGVGVDINFSAFCNIRIRCPTATIPISFNKSWDK